MIEKDPADQMIITGPGEGPSSLSLLAIAYVFMGVSVLTGKGWLAHPVLLALLLMDVGGIETSNS